MGHDLPAISTLLHAHSSWPVVQAQTHAISWQEQHLGCESTVYEQGATCHMLSVAGIVQRCACRLACRVPCLQHAANAVLMLLLRWAANGSAI